MRQAIIAVVCVVAVGCGGGGGSGASKATYPEPRTKYQGETAEYYGAKAMDADAGTADRPLNICIWGGQTDLAQALLHVKQTRSDAGLAKFVRLFRVYDIDDQDGLAKWMRAEFPGMSYILAKSWDKRDKREGVYRGMYLTGDESLTSLDWIDKHIRSTGPLGELYPTKAHTDPNPNRCMKEGDSPSWFFFLPLGGNDPSDPTKPGWGGQFEKQHDGWYRDFPKSDSYDPRHTVSRWRPEFQLDFARRMAWCVAK